MIPFTPTPEEKHYNPAQFEPHWQKFWENEGIYALPLGRSLRASEVFSIDTPPPTVSGSLHIGHVYSYTQTEIIARYQRLTGKVVFYPFGFDNNGLATEILAERELGKKAREFTREEFNHHCLSISGRYIEGFKTLWKSLGFSCDWKDAYSTISPEAVAISQRSFLDLFRRGHLSLRSEPTLWCTRCHTSFAQAEVNSQNIAGTFNFVTFKTDQGTPFQIATTRPELLGSCVAVFIHPNHPTLSSLIGQRAVIPLFNHTVPILGDQKADPEKGTGVVMCCTFGDATDIEWWREYKLDLRLSLTPEGQFTELSGPLRGLYVKQAREKVVELLRSGGFLVRQEAIPAENRPVNVHERCDTEVEFIPVKQWFIDILKERQNLIQRGREIQWHPDHMRKRYEDWVEGLKWDWAISRQRYYGVPIPVWYCSTCQATIPAREEDLPVNPLRDQPRGTCQCGGNQFVGEKDVLDTWATSSVTPQIIAKWKTPGEREYLFPTSMRPQAHDIIRTWAMYTIVKSHYHFASIPWHDIVISGHVVKKGGTLDATGRKTKISKSRDGKAFDPMELLKRHSADCIRLWTINSRLGTDTTLEEEELKEGSKLLTKLWNVGKFVAQNLSGWDSTRKIPPLAETDRWILGRLAATLKEYHLQAQQFEMGLARKALDWFFWHYFCDNYLEFTKFRVYGNYGSESREAAQATLYHLFFKILQMYSPIIPHLTETLYQFYYAKDIKEKSIHITRFDRDPVAGLVVGANPDDLAMGEKLMELVGAVRGYQTREGYPKSLAVSRLAGAGEGKLLRSLAAILGVPLSNIQSLPGEDFQIIGDVAGITGLAIEFDPTARETFELVKALKAVAAVYRRERCLPTHDPLPPLRLFLANRKQLDVAKIRDSFEKLAIAPSLEFLEISEKRGAPQSAIPSEHPDLFIEFY